MPDLPPRLKVLYPFEGHAFRSAAGAMNYVDTGTGPPIVMLHGNPTWSFFYRDLILELQDTNRCLALDHLGCGLSDKPQEGKYDLAGHIQRAAEWITGVDPEPFHLVVHDWGGAIGFGMADKLRDRIKGITILNTAAYSFPRIPLRIAVCRIPLVGAFLVRGLNGFVKGACRMCTVEPLSPAAIEGFCYPYQSWHDRIAIHRFVRDIPMRKRHSSWPALKAVEASLHQWERVPVQIIWGMRDWCFHPGFLDRWQQILPHAEVHRIDRAGHYLFEDAADEVTSLVRQFSSRLL